MLILEYVYSFSSPWIHSIPIVPLRAVISADYSGHYIVLMDYDRATDEFVCLNPSRRPGVSMSVHVLVVVYHEVPMRTWSIILADVWYSQYNSTFYAFLMFFLSLNSFLRRHDVCEQCGAGAGPLPRGHGPRHTHLPSLRGPVMQCVQRVYKVCTKFVQSVYKSVYKVCSVQNSIYINMLAILCHHCCTDVPFRAF